MTPTSPKALVAGYTVPRIGRASWQILTSIGPYLALWAVMAWTVTVSWWLTLPLAMFAGLLLVRVFIIFHDCGHGSFFSSSRANTLWGFVTGVLTWTPYEHWRGLHAVHHGTNGNLDRRGVGDIWTMTVQEYRDASWWRRTAYRIVRNPLVLLLVAPLVMFVFDNRLPSRRANPRERRSVWLTTLAILAWSTGMTFVFGLLPFVIVQLVVLAIAGAIGIWLFYSQHQFDGAYWQRGEQWDFEEAAIRGSAYLKLPRWLQWFTGNIGFHHIHHLNARIPNYNLQACHESHPDQWHVTTLTLARSLRAFRLKLWDEQTGRLVKFRHLRELPKSHSA